MSQLISGPGVGLPLPQNLYPSYLQNAPIDSPTNKVALAAGDAMIIPAGDWFIDAGSYCIIQFLDPVSNTWRAMPSAAWNSGYQFIKSDGFTTRIANLTGCVYNIVPTAYGTGWVQASTSLTVVGPTNVAAAPIVGGQITLVGGTLTSVGAGYGMAPLVLIPAPPPPANNSNGVGGIQASAYAGIAGGTVSFISFTNPGAGYPSAPIPVIVPNPADPNLNIGITQAVAAFSLVGSGSITGALVTYNGSPLPDGSMANVTVTIGGAGSAATLVANVMQTVKAGTVVGTGLGFGTGNALLVSAGGSGAAGTVVNGPEVLGLNFRPRPAQVVLTGNAGGTVAAQVGSIVDGGLFLSAPTPVLATNPAAVNTSISGATISFVMGSRPDIITLQPAP
jgi:hypothetical protein